MAHEIYDTAFFNKIGSGSQDSAAIVVPAIVCLVPACHSVVDFGCGTGAWLSTFKQSGIKRVRGLDFARAPKEVFLLEDKEFTEANLCEYQNIGRFDLCISLEVAEHLPRDSADTFVRSLTSASDLVVFSAAVPDQGGDGHLNEQWPSSWHEKFRAHGFGCLDIIRPAIWSDARISWWYRQNIFLYYNLSTIQLPGAWMNLQTFGGFDLVHPDMLAHRLWKIRSEGKCSG